MAVGYSRNHLPDMFAGYSWNHLPDMFAGYSWNYLPYTFAGYSWKQLLYAFVDYCWNHLPEAPQGSTSPPEVCPLEVTGSPISPDWTSPPKFLATAALSI